MDKHSALFLMGKDIPWERIDPKIERQIVGFNNEIMMVNVKFDVGGIGPMHEHYHSQVTYIVSGVFEMTIGEETRTISAGDSYFIPPHVMHGIVCKEAGILIDVFSPHREDFMESVKS
ncbi:MAG: cupin domain-containing protein [Schleiferiaceae bacterium]